MIKRLLLTILVIFIITSQNYAIDKDAKKGYETIKASNLKTHLTVLTSDSLEGRETTYPGQKKAAYYIADIFRKLKLEAIGDSGTYLQRFDVDHIRVNPETNIITEIDGTKRKFSFGTDFISEGTRDTIISGPAAFVGFTDTELDSTAKERLVGRILFVFIGKKSFASDTSKAATLRRLFALRRDAGALTALMIPDPEGPASYQKVQDMIKGWGLDKGSMQLRGIIPKWKLQNIRFIVSQDLAETVLKSSGKTLQQVRNDALINEQFTPIFIDDINITIESKTIRETKQTENVLGLLRGSDPELKSQIVAITAHYDHLGKNKEGSIFVGADDDGSGTATVLDLANAFSKNPIKSRRSILFMTVVGEEKGLLGSQYYTNNPIIPLNQTISNLNIDMIGRLDTIYEMAKDTNSIYVIGSDKISLELDSLLKIANLESENLTLDYRYNNESDPEQYYRRSDHFNFAKNGVPIVFFFDGNHSDYHKISDTIDKILFSRMEKVERLIYTLGWKLANFDRLLFKKPEQSSESQ